MNTECSQGNYGYTYYVISLMLVHMMDLTQKIVTFDRGCEIRLKKVHSATLKAEREADALIESTREEKQHLFEEQKNTEAALLAQEMEEVRKKAIAALHQKMKTFNQEVTTNKVVEHLLSVARDRVCH